MAVTWTATVEQRWKEGKKRHARVKLTTSASGNTYTTGGDAIPSFGAMGMKVRVDYIILTDDSVGDGLVYKYDQANKKLKVFNDNANATYLQNQALGELPAATALNSKTLYCEVVGD